LAVFLLEVYNKAEIAPDAASKARIFSILRLFQPGEPTRKKVIGEAVAWSAKLGEYPAGDPELHHVVGSIYAEGATTTPTILAVLICHAEDEPLEAERHLILGTKDSPPILVKVEYAWYTEDEPSSAPYYLARAVLPYLLTGNVRSATQAHLLFTSQLSKLNPSLSTQDVSSKSSDLRLYPSLPLLNFLGLLLLAVQRGAPELFRMLKSQYKAQLNELGGAWDQALDQIGEMYFGIKIPSTSNPLLDMMGSMFMGGGGGAKKQPKKVGAAAPSAPALD
jgi:golgi to ER traffic protein 4